MDIRPEREGEVAAISSVIAAAFARAAHRSGREAAIVAALRRAGALAQSLVAADGKQVVGHCAFSPVKVDSRTGNWFGLGPGAIHTRAPEPRPSRR